MSKDLPPIRPLTETPQRWADDAQTKCGCNFCQHWYPIMEHIEAQLDDRGKALFNELLTHYMSIEEDASVDAAKLAGNWPGWEAMKDFKPNIDI